MPIARAADAIAEALSERGERQQAVAWLSDSVHLNLAKRSPMGLAYNRQTLELLSARAGADSPDRDALVDLAEKIEIAQAEVQQPTAGSFEATPRGGNRPRTSTPAAAYEHAFTPAT
jgi:hypothetical protein